MTGSGGCTNVSLPRTTNGTHYVGLQVSRCTSGLLKGYITIPQSLQGDDCPLCEYRRTPCLASDPLDDPRFCQLLATGEHTTARDTSTFTKQLDSLRRVRSDLERAILALHSVQVQIDASIFKLEAITSSQLLRTLPNDMLDAIFEWSIPDPCTLRHANFPLDMPWTLAQVCRRWRTVVFANPRLWKNWVVPWMKEPEAQIEHRQAKFEQLATLSGACPVALCISAYSEPAPGDLLSRVAPVLKNSAKRFHALSIDFRSRHDIMEMVSSWPCDRLTRMAVDTAGIPLDTNIDLYGKMPALRTLELSGDSASHTRVPWTQLTNCFLRDVGIDSFEALSHSNIVVLQIRDPIHQGHDLSGPVHPVVLPMLSTFFLAHSESFVVEFVLKRVRAPGLKTLKISVTSASATGEIHIPPLQFSADNVTELVVAYSQANGVVAEDVVAFLRPMRRVSHLYLGLPSDAMVTTCRALQTADGLTILPEMRTMHISSEQLTEFDEEFGLMLAARRHAKCPDLHELSVSRFDLDDRDAWIEIKDGTVGEMLRNVDPAMNVRFREDCVDAFGVLDVFWTT